MGPAVARRFRRTGIGAALAARRAPARWDLVSEGLASFRARFPVPPADDRPIFALGSSWRSGSTLLQRLLVSDDGVHLWGEPWARTDPIRSLAEGLAGITETQPEPGTLWSPALDGDERLADQWIANLSPAPEAVVEAHRDFLRRFLAPPRAGQRWGCKEVRLGVEHAEYLRLLFPAAGIVFVHRDPYEQWRSYAAFRNWYRRWPHDPVATPGQFGRMWHDLVAGFHERGAAAGVLVVAYADLVSGAAVDRIEEHLGVRVDRSVLGNRVGSSVPGGSAGSPAPRPAALRRAVAPLAADLGYG